MTQNSLLRLCILLLATGIGCATPAQSSRDAGAGDTSPTTDATTSDLMGSDGTAPDLVPDTAPIIPTCLPPADKDHPADKLSQTGCMDPKNLTHFAPGVFAYEVNSPLWSDGADKDRGFFLPPGGKVHVLDCAKEANNCRVGPQDTGKWIFPVGTVMVKSFRFDGKLVETRLFVRFDEKTWVGYGYEWNEAQTDATIVPIGGAETMFNTGVKSVDWHYPSRDDCMQCHFVTAGFTLGPEMKQMNRMVGGENQIDNLAKRDVFDQAPSKPYQAPLATPYAGSWGQPSQTATLEERARSYLHANCQFCHRPDSNFPDFDVRYGIALENTNICNVTPERGNVDVDGAMLLTPGSPEASTIWSRLKSLQPKVRMPNIGSFVVDQDALKLIGDWITSIPSCPQP